LARRNKQKRRQPPRTQRRLLSQEEVSITSEAANIIRRAQNRDARVISLGPLVFFSTQTGDAWLLDPQDGLAVCLARDEEPQPHTIIETSSSFGIDWQMTYRIKAEMFVVIDRAGRTKTIMGYPTREILAASRRPR
jgi:hypothetical protein